MPDVALKRMLGNGADPGSRRFGDPAGQPQRRRRRIHLAEPRIRAEQRVEILARLERAHEQNRPASDRRGAWLPGWRAGRADDDAITWDAESPLYLAGGKAGNGDHGGGPAGVSRRQAPVVPAGPPAPPPRMIEGIGTGEGGHLFRGAARQPG